MALWHWPSPEQHDNVRDIGVQAIPYWYFNTIWVNSSTSTCITVIIIAIKLRMFILPLRFKATHFSNTQVSELISEKRWYWVLKSEFYDNIYLYPHFITGCPLQSFTAR